MAHYDDATQKFMHDSVSEEERKSLLLRRGASMARAIVTQGPKSIPRQVVKGAIQLAMLDMSKEGSLPLLKIIDSLNTHYDWHKWEPETLWQTIAADLGVIPDEGMKNALQAFQVIAGTNFAFEDWHTFEKVGHALNESPVTFGEVQPLELDAVARTCLILNRVRPGVEYEDDVCAYIAACAKHAGVVFLPESLFPVKCQSFLDGMGNDIVLRDACRRSYPGSADVETPLGLQLARLTEIKNYTERTT